MFAPKRCIQQTHTHTQKSMKIVALSFEKLKVFGIKWTIIRDVMLSFEGLYYSNCFFFVCFVSLCLITSQVMISMYPLICKIQRPCRETHSLRELLDFVFTQLHAVITGTTLKKALLTVTFLKPSKTHGGQIHKSSQQRSFTDGGRYLEVLQPEFIPLFRTS